MDMKIFFVVSIFCIIADFLHNYCGPIIHSWEHRNIYSCRQKSQKTSGIHMI